MKTRRNISVASNKKKKRESLPQNNPRKRPMLLPVAAAASVLWTSSVSAQSCDFNNDKCPYQFDGECDANVYCSANSDCFDCDPCAGFNLDCGLCTAAGCMWCPYDASCLSAAVGESVWDLHPQRQPGCRSASDWQADCTVNPDNVFTDPLYSSMQWIFSLIRVEEVWRQGITGAGIHVRVNDDGVDATHPEFVDHFDVANSCEIYLPRENVADDNHGTACASIIAGAQDNGVCAVGIAPDATLSACNAFADPNFSGLEDASNLFMTHLEVVDIISNSWGPTPCKKVEVQQRQSTSTVCPFQVDTQDSPCEPCGGVNQFDSTTWECEAGITKYCSKYYELDPIACGEYLDLYVTCDFHTLSQGNEEGFAQIIAQGRGGKGPIITFAGGNDYRLGVDANSDGMVNSRYTIGVGAVGKDGKHASYSTIGAAVFIVAPGGDSEALSNNIVANPGGGCHDITIGTSFATPVVSGVAALILQANPELTYRDVQGVMQRTAQLVDLDTDTSWVTNGAGISHSYKYGFGLIDAAAAVTTAQTWVNWGPEKQIMVESGTIDVPIPDNTASPNGALAVLTITEEDVIAAAGVNNIQLEAVVLYLELVHGSRGDVQVTLTSPQGTPSILAPSKRPENTIFDSTQRWKLMTLRSWGENPVGTWTLEIADEKAGLIEDCVDRLWQANSDGLFWVCDDFIPITDCSSPTQVAPSLQLMEFMGLTIFDACCACGGGVDATALDQRLVSWRMIAYGHEHQATPETPPPTAPPSSQSTATATTTQTPIASNQSTAIPQGNQTLIPGNGTATPATQTPATQTPATQTPATQTPSTTQTVVPAVQTVSPAPVPTTQTPAVSGLPPVDSASCAYRSDTCPVHVQFDRQCDEAAQGCPDCFDCDPCQAYSYDCANCVANGCVWCPGDAICLSVALDAQYWATYSGQVISSCPAASDWTNTCVRTPTNVFADPLYDAMALSYKMIKVEEVWRQGVTGAGVHVRVNDKTGVDGNHAELSTKFDIANSCTDYLPTTAADDHGTGVASIIAAANNNECAVGIAPGATVSACKIPENNDAAEAQAFLEKFQTVDISTNSYGPDTCINTVTSSRNLQNLPCPFSRDYDLSPCDICGATFGQTLTDQCLQAVAQYCDRYFEVDQTACTDYMHFFVTCSYHFLPTAIHDAWTRTITEGRSGKGIVYVVSAGNLYNRRANSNANSMVNSRFTMAIGAVGKDGLHASYSTAGSSVFLSAPGGDFEDVSGNIVAKPMGGCQDVSVGTDFAAPVVSGVVALMLSVAPDLTWRDVQGVLASTAQVVDATDASWAINAAGIRFSHKYGFGLVDAAAAVASSRTWQNWGNEIEIVGDTGELNTVIQDLTQFDVTMTVSDPRNLKVEGVEVFLDLPHHSRGDLRITLRSPGGTDSVLAEEKRPINQQFTTEQRWKFLSYAAWGESPVGNWVLTIGDLRPGLLSTCSDLAWGVEQNGQSFSCDAIKNAGVTDCSTQFDQAIIMATFEGRTAVDACCVCGGGQEVTEVTNVLNSWRMLIYAHDADVTPAPVALPVTAVPAGTGAPVVTQAPVPARPTNAAPVPLTSAVVMTTAPGITRPWITNGASDATSDGLPTARAELQKMTSLLTLLVMSLTAPCFLLAML
ncbi:Furin-like protease 1, isoform 1 [Seminavis robusta]|uniref:subtilisin n=1 Tax=Seminavis robusta TaxID=568900 RepID=A0A9N8DQV5_9STRA|nr:Furin-like protease 1, isoform 1 [Seminavis robusta]|eukprot:Sro217_g089660.1 Furin-like protease 1, isoform 1 (1626) ;mRNA; f:19433-25827